MSSRALRKLQREQEQQQQQEKLRENSVEDEESEEDLISDSKVLNAFDMLAQDADAVDDVSESAESNGQEAPPVETEPVEASQTTLTKNKFKGKTRNKKAKNKKTARIVQDDSTFKNGSKTTTLDEIDLALSSLSTKDRDVTNISTNNQDEELHRLLAVENKHLNALNEMKRLFGKEVLEGGDEDAGVPRRRHGRGQRNLDLGGALAAQNSRISRGQGLAGLALRRNVFMLGKEEWPKATSGGLGMEITEKPNDGTTHYRFVHNSAYQDVQIQFESCVESMDPQRMIQLLQFNPYHISTLLQVSEIAKQQGDHSVSGDLLERALFSFGRSVHSSFSAALSQGKARLDFRRPESREFWLAAWRYIHNLGQRGTWRTAYEWAKLILSLEPESDPYCVRLILDQLALRGSQMDHFLKLSKCPIYNDAWYNSSPNIRISCALAEYKLKRPEDCRNSLRSAIYDYPWIFHRLFQELNIEYTPKSIWGKKAGSQREKLECELYINYAKDLWNSPDVISLLVEVTEIAESSQGLRNSRHITMNEARHVLLSGTPTLMGFIPRDYTTMSTSSSDPLPPPDSLPSYSTAPPERLAHSSPEILDPPPDIGPRNSEAGSAQVQDEEQELQGLQGFFSRIMPWLGQSETVARPAIEEATDETLNLAANESGVPQEIIAERGTRLLWLLRRVLGRQQQEQQVLEAQTRQGPRASRTEEGDLIPEAMLRQLGANPGLNIVPMSDPSSDDEEEDEDAAAFESTQENEAYNDDRSQRWLAGQGLIRLREAAAAHGTNETHWADTPRALLKEYAARIVMLAQPRSRNYILDYALPQGTSKEVKEMVLREVENQRRQTTP